MKIISKQDWYGYKITLLDYGRLLYIPVFGFYFGKRIECDSLGCRYFKVFRSFAFQVHIHDIRYSLRITSIKIQIRFFITKLKLKLKR